MKLKQSTLAAAVTAVLALGAAGQAAASTYAHSTLQTQNLSIVITDTAAPGTPLSAATTFNFNLTNTATLNGVGSLTVANCNGTFGVSNNCGAVSPRLDALPANAPGNDAGFDRVNNSFALLGPGAGQYSGADSVITTAQLTGDATTATQQIAESELQGGLTASASSLIQSTTGFTFIFTISGTGALTLNFDADPSLRALIAEGIAGAFASQADLSVTFALSKDDGTAFVNWAADGTATDNCLEAGGPTCVETADTQDLNLTIGTVTDGSDITHSPLVGFSAFGISMTGLTAGTWTLTLAANTSTLLTRQPVAVPEPGILALLGIGLAGLGAMRRKSRA